MKPRPKLNSFNSIATMSTKFNLNNSDSKRFVRKRQSSNELMKNLKIITTPKSSKSKSKLFINTPQSEKIVQKIQTPSYIKNEEMFFINSKDCGKTPKKASDLKMLASFREKCKNIVTQKSELSMWDSQEELQMTKNEVMILKDQNDRLKRKMEENQQTFQQTKQIKLKLKELEYKSMKMVNQMEKLKQQKNSIQDQLSETKEQNQEYKNFYEEFIKTAPSNYLQIKSFREKALEKEIQNLKKKINLSKTEKEQELEDRLNHFTKMYYDCLKNERSLEIAIRVLKKKITYSEPLYVEKIKLEDQLMFLRRRNKILSSENEILKKTIEIIKVKRSQGESRYRRNKSNSSLSSLNLSKCSRQSQ